MAPVKTTISWLDERAVQTGINHKMAFTKCLVFRYRIVRGCASRKTRQNQYVSDGGDAGVVAGQFSGTMS